MFDTGGMGEQLFELRRKTFDTPHFKGIEFIEVECKTILNKVPGNYLPFKWTINPYRGCSHACSYCQAGDTLIQMADGRVKPLAELVVGDAIYGTRRVGRYRRYVRTEVLAHWQTLKRAYRVVLDDGTSLVASGDHRFLSDRGWVHVGGRAQGLEFRPHLTTGNRLLGPGVAVDLPKWDEAYRRGYLSGMMRGDGTLRAREHQFRVALVDGEALERARRFLLDLGVGTDRFAFSAAASVRREVLAAATRSAAGAGVLLDLIEWPCDPSPSWCKGFLAGIYDAQGRCNEGVVRISNTDAELLSRTESYLRALGFDVCVERAEARATTLRLRGGLAERLRFWQTVDPAITRKRSFDGEAVSSSRPRRVVSVEDLGVEIPMYDITTGTVDFIANGVISHNCFARVTHTYLDLGAGRDFETKIYVKVNAPELLRKELRAKRWKGEHIAMGTATTPTSAPRDVTG